MKKIPEYLKYFLYDVLDWDTSFSVKKMFSSYAIYKNSKIFAIYHDSTFYFRQSEFNKQEFKEKWYSQFSYKRNQKTIFLPYFAISEEILENKDLVLEEIEKAINY